MVDMKYAFLAVAIVVVAFIGFLALSGGRGGQPDYGSMPIDETIPVSAGGQQPQAGAQVQVAVRDKQLAAKVVQPPFVRHGKILVNQE